jgi:hypothetical protein
MKTLFICIAILFSSSILGYAQDRIFILHPAVGDTIDITEKKKYLVFPEIDNAGFDYAFITQANRKYTARIVSKNGSVTFLNLSDSIIDQYFYNIEKLNDYYAGLEQRDSFPKANGHLSPAKNDFTDNRVPKNIITPSIKEQISKDADVQRRINEDKEWMKLRTKGLDANDINIDW